MASLEEKEVKLRTIWPYIDKANERCIDVVKIRRERVVLGDSAKPLPKTVKNTVIRSAAFALYDPEINIIEAAAIGDL